MAHPLWSINGRFLTQGVTGVQRYGREIVRSLDRLIAEGHPAGRERRIELLTPQGAARLEGLEMIDQRSVGRLAGHAWEQICLPRHAAGRTLNLCNTAPLAGRRTIVCIHDTNVVDCPASYSPPFRLLYRALIPLVARRAAAVTTVSAYSAGRLQRFGLAPEGIAVLPDGHEHVGAWSGEGRRQPSAPALPANTIVVLGSRAPHKNVAMLADLAPRLAAEGLTLAIAGGVDPRIFKGTAELGTSRGVMSLGRVSDAELAIVLRRALCLAFPSFVEGFGLPALEAFALGCPVVTSNRASLPEVCGDAALYAEPDRPDEWLSAFRSLRDKPRLREDMIRRGYRRAKAFSWRASAIGYLQTMTRLDQG